MANFTTKFDQEFNDMFLDFLESCFPDANLNKDYLDELYLSAMKPIADGEAAELSRALLGDPQSGPMYGFGNSLTQILGPISMQFEKAGFSEFVDTHFEIQPMVSLSSSIEADFVYTKINHGFWEQLLAIYGENVDPKWIRIRDTDFYNPDLFKKMYVDSSFLVPLSFLIANAATVTNGKATFDRVHFAISLLAGGRTHQEILKSFNENLPDAGKSVSSSTAIGAAAYFNVLFGDRTLRAADGSFPKVGLESGALEETIRGVLPGANRIVFVIPPHLDGIRLSKTELAQNNIVISQSHVHETWLVMLLRAARPILKSISNRESVLTFVQAGVFSPLLALFLSIAKRRLNLDNSRLYFFDLGQVLDVANLGGGGVWVHRTNPQGQGLFAMAAQS